MSRLEQNVVTDSLDKWVSRQKNKPRIYGVHLPMFPAVPGESTPGWYVRNRGNLETAKRSFAIESQRHGRSEVA